MADSTPCSSQCLRLPTRFTFGLFLLSFLLACGSTTASETDLDVSIAWLLKNAKAERNWLRADWELQDWRSQQYRRLHENSSASWMEWQESRLAAEASRLRLRASNNTVDWLERIARQAREGNAPKLKGQTLFSLHALTKSEPNEADRTASGVNEDALDRLETLVAEQIKLRDQLSRELARAGDNSNTDPFWTRKRLQHTRAQRRCEFLESQLQICRSEQVVCKNVLGTVLWDPSADDEWSQVRRKFEILNHNKSFQREVVEAELDIAESKLSSLSSRQRETADSDHEAILRIQRQIGHLRQQLHSMENHHSPPSWPSDESVKDVGADTTKNEISATAMKQSNPQSQMTQSQMRGVPISADAVTAEYQLVRKQNALDAMQQFEQTRAAYLSELRRRVAELPPNARRSGELPMIDRRLRLASARVALLKHQAQIVTAEIDLLHAQLRLQHDVERSLANSGKIPRVLSVVPSNVGFTSLLTLIGDRSTIDPTAWRFAVTCDSADGKWQTSLIGIDGTLGWMNWDVPDSQTVPLNSTVAQNQHDWQSTISNRLSSLARLDLWASANYQRSDLSVSQFAGPFELSDLLPDNRYPCRRPNAFRSTLRDYHDNYAFGIRIWKGGSRSLPRANAYGGPWYLPGAPTNYR